MRLRFLKSIANVHFFITGNRYEGEINEKNPIGNRGELARAYGELMKQMWSGNSSSVAPRHFKVQSNPPIPPL